MNLGGGDANESQDLHRSIKTYISRTPTIVKVETIFIENPEALTRLKLLWIRSCRGSKETKIGKAIFKSSLIEIITLKAPL